MLGVVVERSRCSLHASQRSWSSTVDDRFGMGSDTLSPGETACVRVRNGNASEIARWTEGLQTLLVMVQRGDVARRES
jgi:hypothetical protein